MNPEDRVPGLEVLARSSLLRRLAAMKPHERDAWIDQYVLGKRLNTTQRGHASVACARLRDLFGTSDALKDAA